MSITATTLYFVFNYRKLNLKDQGHKDQGYQ